MVRSWLKLVGTTDENLPDDWYVQRHDLLTVVRFAWNKKPEKVANYDRIVLYAVGKKRIFATQRRKGGSQSIRLNDAEGKKGSITYRYPKEMDVETYAYVGDLTDAPRISDVLPGFLLKYRKKNSFRNGSHFEIAPDEFAAMENAILDAGEGKRVEPPPRASS